MAGRFLGLVVLTLGVVLLFSTAATGQAVVIEDVDSRLSQNEKLEVEEILDEVYLFHSQHLPLEPHIKIRLRAYSSSAKYSSFERRIGIGGSAGVYLPREHMAAVNLEYKGYLGTVIHEGQHFILGSAFKWAPAWINEGFSEYIETATVSGHRVTAHRHARNLRIVLALREAGRLPALKTYFALSNRQWQGLDRPPAHGPRAIAWSLVYFLLDSEEGKTVFGTLIGRLARGDGKTNGLLDEIYPGGLSQLEADYHSFLDDTPDEQQFEGRYRRQELVRPEVMPVTETASAENHSDWLRGLWRAFLGL